MRSPPITHPQATTQLQPPVLWFVQAEILALGIVRDSSIGTHLLNERHAGAQTSINQVSKRTQQHHCTRKMWVQSPSDDSEFAHFGVEQRIGAISLNSNSVLKTWFRYCPSRSEHNDSPATRCDH
ncbi:hypothetical protein [Acaryochloris sp. IP29b_bin.137]|uniref:hypothetical protein n=1 Tax=Acaryochloris sp. IP29b_bin.137 TaxID=2969217 RepID=UPI00262FB34B|nr:hypothetical protein [Acaryochloris sp. IP29b_bin.137]